MNISIDTSSLLKFKNHMGDRENKMKGAVQTILKKSILIVQRYGKYYAPVDTGRMRASIGGGRFSGGSFLDTEGVTFGDSFASIGPTVVYAKYVHARVPFMTAAAHDSLAEIERIADQEIKKIL